MLLALGVGGFYNFSHEMLVVRVIGLMAIGGVAVGVFVTTLPGKNAWGFLQGSRTEVRKMVWPSRADESTPSAPRYTSRTSAGCPTMLKTTSASGRAATPPMTAAENMALDETLLEIKGQGRSPDTIHFLQFSPRSVLVGYHQSIQEEIRPEYCREHGIEINRRINGAA